MFYFTCNHGLRASLQLMPEPWRQPVSKHVQQICSNFLRFLTFLWPWPATFSTENWHFTYFCPRLFVQILAFLLLFTSYEPVQDRWIDRQTDRRIDKMHNGRIIRGHLLGCWNLFWKQLKRKGLLSVLGTTGFCRHTPLLFFELCSCNRFNLFSSSSRCIL